MRIVKVNRQGNALRITIPAGYARQLGLTTRDHLEVSIAHDGYLQMCKVPRVLQARSARGEK
jgi:antitoxin component of MazEF toxin-antitoxin module